MFLYPRVSLSSLYNLSFRGKTASEGSEHPSITAEKMLILEFLILPLGSSLPSLHDYSPKVSTVLASSLLLCSTSTVCVLWPRNENYSGKNFIICFII